MSRTSRLCVTSSLALPLCLLLSACGGDSTSVASIPPPPVTPTPTPWPTNGSNSELVTTISGYTLGGSLDTELSWLDTPATRGGSDLLGRVTITPVNGNSTTPRIIEPGEFSMLTLTGDRNDGDVTTYGLISRDPLFGGKTTTPGVFVVGSWDITATSASLYKWGAGGGTLNQALGQRLTAFDKASDGTERQIFSYDLTRSSATSLLSLGSSQELRTDLTYDIGYSYVAMGEWSWGFVGLDGHLAPGTNYGSLLFVIGDRTPSSGIPASGTATYDARALGWVQVPFALLADFGLRTISTRIDQDYRYDPAGDSLDNPLAIGIHVGGSAPFSNDGLFDIPLTGTLNYGYNTPETPGSTATSGDMNGAFFGPHAEQVGGTFLIQHPGGAPPIQSAFVGQQHQP